MIVRSYRRVFRVDRRIYRVDRWALPVPGGIPLRGVGYFALALGLVLVLGRVPGSSELLGVLSPPLRYVIVPLAVAVLGMQAAPDGRVAHRFAADWLRLRVRGRRRSAGRRVPLDGERVTFGGTLATVWDDRAPELHRARVRGPARVTFNHPVELEHGPGKRLLARGRRDGTDGPVVLCAGQELEVR
jgi:TcpE family